MSIILKLKIKTIQLLNYPKAKANLILASIILLLLIIGLPSDMSG